jgi:hypothetical protein
VTPSRVSSRARMIPVRRTRATAFSLGVFMGDRYETSANEIICRGSVTVTWVDYKGFNPTEDDQDWIKTLTHLRSPNRFIHS